MPLHERTPRERETLIFPTAQEAREWQENVEQKMGREAAGGVNRQREVMANELAEQFAREGEGVSVIREPWEHTPAEHKEVQQLVDVAFAHDLPAALKKARQGKHYPRNLDLLHDVLTGEMYALVQQYGLRRQPIGRWIAMGLGLALAAGVLAWAALRWL